MSDLISRQAAIDALEEHLDYLQKLNKDENPTARSKWYGVNWARNTIADLPSAQPEQRWIPCSERLPEEDGYYLVYAPCYFYGSSSGKENHNGTMFSKYKNGKWSIEHGYYERPGCVWAWMPLPEPYSGEDMRGENNGKIH